MFTYWLNNNEGNSDCLGEGGSNEREKVFYALLELLKCLISIWSINSTEKKKFVPYYWCSSTPFLVGHSCFLFPKYLNCFHHLLIRYPNRLFLVYNYSILYLDPTSFPDGNYIFQNRKTTPLLFGLTTTGRWVCRQWTYSNIPSSLFTIMWLMKANINTR